MNDINNEKEEGVEVDGEVIDKNPPCPRCKEELYMVVYGLMSSPEVEGGGSRISLKGCVVLNSAIKWECKKCNLLFDKKLNEAKDKPEMPIF